MTPHFDKAELTCKCGCGMLPDKAFMLKVEGLRVRYGRPMLVSSAARCPEHNAKESGTGRTGPHTTGRAIDVTVARGDAYDLASMAFAAGFTGLGFKQKGVIRFMHLDDLPNAVGQPRPTIWSY